MKPEPTIEIVAVEGRLVHASNATLLGQDHDGQRWIYKPVRGERPLHDFPTGTLAHREVATYRISVAIGIDVVPETQIGDGPFGVGSVQRFLDEDFEWDPRPLIVAADSSLWPIALLDIVSNNADRKIGHLLRQPADDRIWAIDNGLTFHPDQKLRTVLWSFAGLKLPTELVETLDSETVAAAVADLLAPTEVEALADRVDQLRASPTHPQPPDDRPPYPWPLW